MKAIKLIIILGLCSSCINQISNNKIDNAYNFSRTLFPNNIINHIPEHSNINTLSISTNVTEKLQIGNLKNGFIPLYINLVEKYSKEKYYSLQNELKLDKLTKIECNDTNVILIGSYLEMKEYDYFEFIGFEAGKDSYDVINRNIRMNGKTPIPIFNLDSLKGNTYSHLNNNFTIYVIESKKGKFIKEKYLSERNYLPDNWQHGFSKGYAVNEIENIIIYWMIVW